MSSSKKAFREVLAALDGWIEGAQSNHEAHGHRDSDCCKTFAPEDIRGMVADAARSIETKKRRKKGRPDAQPPVLVELILPDGNVYSSHVIQPGVTLRVELRGALRVVGGDMSVIDVPVHIRARVA